MLNNLIIYQFHNFLNKIEFNVTPFVFVCADLLYFMFCEFDNWDAFRITGKRRIAKVRRKGNVVREKS